MVEEFRDFVAKREFLRAIGKDTTDLDQALDAAAKIIKSGDQTHVSVVPQLKAAAGDKFDTMNLFWLTRLSPWEREHGLPGWDNGLCVVHWRQYACFCNGAAKAYLKDTQSAKYLTSYLKQFEDGNVEVSPSVCDSEVMRDGFYNQTLGDTSRHGPSWWVWGTMLVVGGVLLWPVAFGKKGHVR